MLVIVDSGSTKADWRFITDPANIVAHSTQGFNPFLHDSDYVWEVLKTTLLPKIEAEKVQKVVFYGAACSSPERCAIIEVALRRCFETAEIQVEHDLLACARASLQDQPGVSCIIGTGSNSCAYDGQRITDNITNLGYFLGDEGSGGHLGKLLIQAYFYREMPADILKVFEDTYQMDKAAIISEIYGKAPNVFLASFAKFMSEHKAHPFVQDLVNDAFEVFVKRHICKYTQHLHYPIAFVGSIAFHFKDILQTVLNRHALQLGQIIQKPIDPLVNYHLKEEKLIASDH